MSTNRKALVLILLVIFMICGLFVFSISYNMYESRKTPDDSKLILSDRLFFEELSRKDVALRDALLKFKQAVLSNNLNDIYEMRDQKFKDMVSKEVYLKRKENTHYKAVYFDSEKSSVGGNRADLVVTYVQATGFNDAVFTLADHWILDDRDRSWRFISNGFSWGSDVFNR